MMTAWFTVNEVFDIPARGGLVAVGSFNTGATGVHHLRDASGVRVRVLGVEHPTPRTLRTGESILVLERDASAVTGSRWLVEAGSARGHH